MDLLFKRYASPFVLIDQMIAVGRFAEFVQELQEMDGEDSLWDFYLHKVDGKSFNDFKEEVIIQNTEITDEDLETTINNSVEILQGFNPAIK